MKLLAAVLCLFLLVGCAEKQEEPTTPTEESGQSLHVSGHPLETQTSGIMEVFPIEETAPQCLRSLGTDVVLWGESGISLYTGSGLLRGRIVDLFENPRHGEDERRFERLEIGENGLQIAGQTE